MSKQNKSNRLLNVQALLTITSIWLPLLIFSPTGDTTTAPGVRFVRALKQAGTGCDQASAVTLQFGSTLRAEFGDYRCHVYKVTLQAKMQTQLRVNQEGIDLKIELAPSADGQSQDRVEIDRPTGSWGVESLTLVAETEQTYFVEVKPIESNPRPGRYSILITRQRPSESKDRVRVTAEKHISNGEKSRASADNENLPNDIRRPRLEKAVAEFQTALSLWKQLNEPYEQAVALYGLGITNTALASLGMVKFPLPSFRPRWSYESRDRLATAVNELGLCEEIMSGLRDSYGQAIAEAGRAWPNLYLGRAEEALERFSRSVRLFRSLDNRRGQGIALYGMGWAYALANENLLALNSFLESLPHRENVNDTNGLAITKASVARILNRLGRNDEALKYGQEALDLFRGRRHGTASTLSIMAWTYFSKGEFQEAKTNFERVQQLRNDLKDDTGEANAIYGLARVDREQGRTPEALNRMKRVLELVERLRDKGSTADLRTYYFANVQEYYSFYIELLMAVGRDAEALGVSERSRARDLLATLAESETETGKIDNRWARPLEAISIQKLLERDSVLLEIYLSETKSYAWFVNDTEVRSIELPDRSTLETKASNFYSLITARNRREVGETERDRRIRIADADVAGAKAAEELSQIILGPFRHQIQNKRLLFVSHGALQMLPFAALPDPMWLDQQERRPLLLDHEIVNLPSASILAALRNRSSQNLSNRKSIALFADPVFTSDDPRVRKSKGDKSKSESRHSKFALVERTKATESGEESSMKTKLPRLTGTRWEAEKIASLVRQDDSLMILDFDANRSRLLADGLGDFRIIHFATHAIVDNKIPSASHLVLSRVNEFGQSRNGSLTLSDIYHLNLNAELVVLSACNTGLGKDVKGEGLIGLASSFMHAGAPRVIASLWPVKDKVAAEFMVNFYKKLLQNRSTATSALRAAQEDLMKDKRFEAPYYWASFFQQGEW